MVKYDSRINCSYMTSDRCS